MPLKAGALVQTVSDYINQTGGEHKPQSRQEQGGAASSIKLSRPMLELEKRKCSFCAQRLMLFGLFLLTGDRPANCLFAPGRVPPGSFEYDGLNG